MNSSIPRAGKSARRRVLWILAGLAGAGAVALAVAWWALSRDAQSFMAYFALRVPKTITKVLDRNGDVIGVFAEEHRVVIPFGDIPRAFVGAAFTQGTTPAQIVEDVPTRFLFHATAYEPKNYERDFWGPIPIWEAVRGSRNLPTVRTLQAVGIDNVIAFTRVTGLAASAATQAGDIVQLAFKPGTAPRSPSTSEAIAAARAARAQAHALPVRIRPWVGFRPEAPVPPELCEYSGGGSAPGQDLPPA